MKGHVLIYLITFVHSTLLIPMWKYQGVVILVVNLPPHALVKMTTSTRSESNKGRLLNISTYFQPIRSQDFSRRDDGNVCTHQPSTLYTSIQHQSNYYTPTHNTSLVLYTPVYDINLVLYTPVYDINLVLYTPVHNINLFL